MPCSVVENCNILCCKNFRYHARRIEIINQNNRQDLKIRELVVVDIMGTMLQTYQMHGCQGCECQTLKGPLGETEE